MNTALVWRYPFAFLEACRRRYGPTFTVRVTGHPPLVFLSDPADIREVLTAGEQMLCAGEGARPIAPIVGQHSFMLLDGLEHQGGRRSVLAAFSLRETQKHSTMVEQVALHAIARWPTDTPISLHPHLRSLTLEIILRTITGQHHGALEPHLATLQSKVLAMLSITSSPVLTEPYLRHGPGARRWRRFVQDRTDVDEILRHTIETLPADRRAAILPARPRDSGADVQSLDRDHLMSLILAGHETTASQLAWSFQLLARKPEVQARLAKEALASTDERYLLATTQEILRHRCTFVFAVPRAVAQDTAIEDTLYAPPAHLLPCIYLLHHDPAIYSEPHAFAPERFLDHPPDPRTWLPWGGGRKRCPGLHMATLEIKTILQTALQRLTVEPALRTTEHPRWRSVIVTPHAGAQVRLRPRSRRQPPSAGIG